VPVLARANVREFARGVAYSHDWSSRGANGYGSDADRAQLDRLGAHGVSWIAVMPYAIADGASARSITSARSFPMGERDPLVESTIRDARARGLRVVLKPHLWVRGSWPGALGADRGAARELVRSWAAIIDHYADMAERTGADALAIGTEMDRLAESAPEEWRAIIAAARARFRGIVTYCANWDSYPRISFWRELDVISIQDYAPRADGAANEARLATLAARTREVIGRYAAFSRRNERPVWLTEVGFRCDSDALEHPWRWPTPEDRCQSCDLQARAFDATLAAIAERPEVRGVFAWKWFTSGGAEDEGRCGFALTDAQTRSVLQRWYRESPLR
jgi:hypothetical protein